MAGERKIMMIKFKQIEGEEVMEGEKKSAEQTVERVGLPEYTACISKVIVKIEKDIADLGGWVNGEATLCYGRVCSTASLKLIFDTPRLRKYLLQSVSQGNGTS
jgi:hypothetical protein